MKRENLGRAQDVTATQPISLDVLKEKYLKAGETSAEKRARLAKQLLHLARSYGVTSLAGDGEIRISLQLAQEELAQLLGASRQRVNQELKTLEREGSIRIEPTGLVVRDRPALRAIVDAGG